MSFLNVFVKIDSWVGKTLFIPIIIRICQQFKISQYQFADAISVLGYILVLSNGHLNDWFDWVIVGLLTFLALGCVVRLISSKMSQEFYMSAMLGDVNEDYIAIRLFGLCSFLIFLIIACFGPMWFTISLTLASLFFLSGLYALEIRFIPPRNQEKKLSVSTA